LDKCWPYRAKKAENEKLKYMKFFCVCQYGVFLKTGHFGQKFKW
jgi:hypothetical protein